MTEKDTLFKQTFQMWEKFANDYWETAMKESFLKQTFKLWEKFASEYLEMLIKSPVFLETVGKVLENSTMFKAQLDKAVGTMLASLQLPIRSDQEKILTTVQAIESQLQTLSERLDKIAGKGQQTGKQNA